MALQDIDHFVIVMLENRSFDHMLGYLSLEGGRADVDGLDGDAQWMADHTNVVGAHTYPPNAFEQPDGKWDDPPHGVAAVATQINTKTLSGKLMGGFVKAYDDAYAATPGHPEDPGRAMGHQTAATVPACDFLAREFVVCDRWFCPLPSSTQPNRLMAASGYSDLSDTHNAPLPDQTMVHDWLDSTGPGKAKIPWRLYVHGGFVPFFFLMPKWIPEMTASLFLHLGGAGRRFKRFQDDFASDWKNQPTMPSVIFLEPEFQSDLFQGTPDDDHPPISVQGGQHYVLDIYRALIANPARWKKTMLIVTYDEHGGFFDHVPPLKIKDTAQGVAFATTGPRVAAMVASPQVERGGVFSQNLDHTSILQMLAERFVTSGPKVFSAKVTARQGQAPDTLGKLGDVLTVPPSDTPRAPVPPAPAPEVKAFAAVAAASVATVHADNPSAMSRAFDNALQRAHEQHPDVAATPEWQALVAKRVDAR